MKLVPMSLLSLALVLQPPGVPTVAQDDTTAPPDGPESVVTCLRLTTDAALEEPTPRAIAQLLLDGAASVEVVAAEMCAPAREEETLSPTPYVDFVAHAAGAAVELVALGERSRSARGLIGLDRAAKRLARWAKRQRRWLDGHPPEACYADVHAQWRRGVVAVRRGARDVRTAVRTLRPEPMRRAVRSLAAGVADLSGIDLDPVSRACAEAARASAAAESPTPQSG